MGSIRKFKGMQHTSCVFIVILELRAFVTTPCKLDEGSKTSIAKITVHFSHFNCSPVDTQTESHFKGR
jgi:hypothetical protein